MFIIRMTSLHKMSWIFLVLVLSTGTIQGKTIISPPENFTGTVGGTARFSCEVAFVGIRKLIFWEFNDNPVYNHQFGLEDYPLGEKKYSVTQDNATFVLTVKDLDLEDGGQYTCRVLSGSETAVLLVLDIPQFLHTSLNPEEGSTETYVCTAQFGGPSKENISPGQYPQLVMFSNGSALNETGKEHQLQSSMYQYNLTKIYNTTLEASMNGKELTCKIETSSPAVSKTVTTVIKVLYSVRNTTYAPNNTQYEVGSAINCSADGNPKPGFLWEDMHRGNHIQGQSLLISEPMVGSNTWKCTANNTVGGKTHRDSVFVVFEAVHPRENTISSESSNDFWKIAVGATIPICLIVVGLAALYCRRRLKKQMYAPVVQDEEINLESSEETELEEEDTTGRIERQWIDPSNNNKHKIVLNHVVLEVLSKSFSQPVMISVRETDVTELRQQQMESLGLCNVLTSALQLNLKPTGLTLDHAIIQIKDKEWTHSNSLLMFREEDKWTDFTVECKKYIYGKMIGFGIHVFGEIELLLCSSPSVIKGVSESAIGILNRPLEAKSIDDHSHIDTVHQANHQIEDEKSPSSDAKKSWKDQNRKWKGLMKKINGLQRWDDLNAVTARKIEKLLHDLNGKTLTEGPSALLQLIEKAEILIQSDYFVGVTEAAVQSCSSTWETMLEDPLLCLTELLEKDGISPLTQHPKKLLDVIKILLQSGGSLDTSCFCSGLMKNKSIVSIYR